VQRLGDHVAMCCESLGDRILHTACVDIHDGYKSAARLACHRCHEQADSSGTYDKCS